MYVQRLSAVEMSRVCCCTISHADTISSITTMQTGVDAISRAKNENHDYTISVLEQVVGECVGVHMRVCVC